VPLYEYLCRACGVSSELLVRSSDERLACPACGAEALSKQLSVPAAPAVAGGQRGLPLAGPAGDAGGCGKPQCARGCMFGSN
jgi:putative FmdB family regulatory protein